MCKYCEVKDRMLDFRGERLVSERIGIGALGYIDFEVSIAEDYECEAGELDNLHIIMGDDRDADSILQKTVPINFCPMCGRKLREDKENV